MSIPDTVQDRNRDLARTINEEALNNPTSPYAGKFVGIVNGQVITVGNDLDEVARELQKLGGSPWDKFVLEAGRDYTEVQEIWSTY